MMLHKADTWLHMVVLCSTFFLLLEVDMFFFQTANMIFLWMGVSLQVLSYVVFQT